MFIVINFNIYRVIEVLTDDLIVMAAVSYANLQRLFHSDRN